jgi:hypothetical protein
MSPSRELVTLLARGLEARPPFLHVPARPHRELAHVVLTLPDDLRDLVVRVVEHLPQEKDGALLGREALEQDEEGKGQRVGHLRLPRRILRRVGDERLGQPLAHVALAPRPRRAQLVDPEPRDHGREVRARRLDPLACLERVVDAEVGLLHHVLRLAHAAQHPVGDRERLRPQLLEGVELRHL